MKNIRNISSPDNEVNTERKDKLVDCPNCCQIFARFVLDIFGEFQNKLTKRETYRPTSGKMSKESNSKTRRCKYVSTKRV